jgi:deoxyribonuclease-4
MKIKIGPSGLGPVATSKEILERFKEAGFGICEIAFTHSVYINKESAIRIGKIAKELGIELSIHAPYFVNLNSDEKPKVHASMQRILKSCEIGHYLGAKNIIFHPGYYGNNYAKKDIEKQAEIRKETYQNIKQRIIEMREIIKERKWNVELCPETMGKINVFGSVEEISKLVKETGCSFCIDFAHILAREKKVDYGKIKKLFPEMEWHCHFSGIEYNEKGERHHINLERKQWEGLFDNLPKEKNISIDSMLRLDAKWMLDYKRNEEKRN